MGIDKRQHAQAIEDIDSRLSLEDHRDLNNILTKTRLNLASALDDPDFLLIDKQDTIDSLKTIETKLGEETTNNSLLYNIKDRIDQVEDIITKAGSGGGKKGIDTTSFHREIMELNKLKTNINTNRMPRYTEYKKLADVSGFFSDTIKNKSFDLSTGSIELNPGTRIAGANKNLDDVFFGGAVKPDKKDVSMQLCDAHGEPLKEDKNGNPILEMTDNQGTTHEVVLENNTTPPKPFFDKKTHKINWSKLIIRDIKTNKEISYDEFDLSKAISLSTLTKVDAGGIKVANMKSFSIKLDTKNVSKKMDEHKQYTFFNSTAIPDWHIKDLLINTYNHTYKNVENAILDKMLESMFSSEDEKKQAKKQILNLDIAGTPLSPLIVDSDELLDGFKIHLFSKVRKPTNDELSSEKSYQNYLKEVLPEAMKDYLTAELNRQINSTQDGVDVGIIDGNTINKPQTRNVYGVISAKIFEIKNNSEANRKDNDIDKNNLTIGVNSINSPIKTHSSLFGLLKQSDISYMKYLTKQSIDIPEQKIPVEVDNTNNEIEHKTYSGKFSIDAKGTNIFSINIENGEEFTLKATDHVTLIKQILKDPRIPYDKMKVHVAYSVCKSLIQCTQQAGIPLEKMEAGKFSRIKLDKNNSIVFEEFDDSTGTRKKTSLFSEADALKKGDMGLVQQGIEKVLKQFDTILSNRISNQTGALKSKLLKTDFPTSRAGSPFKKLRNMGKNKMEFGFSDFQIPNIDRDVKVSLHNNLFTIHVDGVDKDIVGKDLGQMLVKNKVFSGMEHKITGAIYKKLITNTAKYPRFGSKKFFVKDSNTDRAYMIDKDGDISYVPLNDPMTLAALAGKKGYGIVNDKNNPLTQTVLSDTESQGFYEDPHLSGQLLKAMMKAL